MGTISQWSIQTASNGQTKTFGLDYDVADQLVSSLVQITNGSSGTQSQYGYSYDNAGNRTGFQSDLTVASAQANSFNQLTQVTTGQGPLTVFGNTNRSSTVSVNGVSAKNLPNNSFSAQIPVNSGQNPISVTARDGSPRARTDRS